MLLARPIGDLIVKSEILLFAPYTSIILVSFLIQNDGQFDYKLPPHGPLKQAVAISPTFL